MQFPLGKILHYTENQVKFQDGNHQCPSFGRIVWFLIFTFLKENKYQMYQIPQKKKKKKSYCKCYQSYQWLLENDTALLILTVQILCLWPICTVGIVLLYCVLFKKPWCGEGIGSCADFQKLINNQYSLLLQPVLLQLYYSWNNELLKLYLSTAVWFKS